MRVLFVTSEFADFAKAGGLADVCAALPRALRAEGADVRVVLPAYQKVIDALGRIEIVASLPRRDGIEPCLLAEACTSDGIVLYLVVSPSLYQREGSAYGSPDGTDWPDNDLRFARLSLAAAEIARGFKGLGWRPDIVHSHDWPSALTPAYVAFDNIGVPTLMTVHNLAHQGIFPAERRAALSIPNEAFTMEGVEFYGKVSFLKAGLFYSNHVTTVSPTYAREITTEALGGGLHGLLAGMAASGGLTGIVNGIGDDWRPETALHVGRPFGRDDPTAKRWIKERVSTSLCLAPSDGPLFGIVSRLVHQKGMDLLAEVAPEIVGRGGQIAILGIGDPETEEMLRALVRNHRDQVAMLNGFNEPMAHRIMAASDFYLMPSRFEPCGLSQLHAQRYGSIPIAHATGGLVDTVIDGETGFLFPDFTADSFTAAIELAFATFADETRLARMRRAAMSQPFDWAGPAKDYLRIYCRLTGRPALRVAASEPTDKLPGKTPVGLRPAGSAVGPVLARDMRAASFMSIL